MRIEVGSIFRCYFCLLEGAGPGPFCRSVFSEEYVGNMGRYHPVVSNTETDRGLCEHKYSLFDRIMCHKCATNFRGTVDLEMRQFGTNVPHLAALDHRNNKHHGLPMVNGIFEISHPGGALRIRSFNGRRWACKISNNFPTMLRLRQ